MALLCLDTLGWKEKDKIRVVVSDNGEPPENTVLAKTLTLRIANQRSSSSGGGSIDLSFLLLFMLMVFIKKIPLRIFNKK